MRNIFIFTLLIGLIACKSNQKISDATGVFEAIEVIVSAEAAGRILQMPIQEGQNLKIGELAATIDCNQLQLQRNQAVASQTAVGQKQVEAGPQTQILREQQAAQEKQLSVQQEQMRVLMREQERFSALVKAQAAPAKQLADLEGQMNVLRKQIDATQSQIAITVQQAKSHVESIGLQNRAIGSERAPIQAKIEQINDQIMKCQVTNPVTGTILVKYAEANELATPGKALYKIGVLDTMILRAYITADQLGNLKLGQDINVRIDQGPDAQRVLPGHLVWVSDKAEFTPKTIQTKAERTNLVYAIKVRVPNDGSVKIGMYGELDF